jgi:hypothetical protein
MRRFVILLLLMSVALSAPAAQEKQTEPKAGAAATPMTMENCPMKLPGTDVTVSNTPTGVTLTITTKTENVAELQRRIQRMTAMHSGERPMGKPPAEPKTEPEKGETDHSTHHPAGKL